jgi:hypothetical protein
MAAAFSPLSTQPVFYNGQYIVGAKIYVFYAGTNTPCTAYADGASNAEHTSPFLTDGNGCIPPFWVPNRDYKVVITTSTGRVIRTIDNLPATSNTTAGGGAGGGGVVQVGTKIPPGFLMPAHATGAVDGWVRANGRSIGNTISGATERANEDTLDLFAHLWASDSNLTVTGGRGNSPEDDFGLGKQISLPDYRGRVPVGLADMGGTDSGRLNGVPFANGTAKTLGASTGTSTVALTIAQLAQHTHSGSSVLSGSHNHVGTTAQDGVHTHGATADNSGIHVHSGTTAGSGGHTHVGSASTNGTHTHTASTDTTGSHSHTQADSGAHGHSVGSGTHSHPIVDPGHSHASQYDSRTQGTAPDQAGERDIYAAGTSWNYPTTSSGTGISIPVSGDHTHLIAAGDHTHTLNPAGSHSHIVSIADGGGHTHSIALNAVTDHVHDFAISSSGSHTHALTIANSASHSHAFTTADNGSHTHDIVINQTGSGEAHPNMQPSITATWYIKL